MTDGQNSVGIGEEAGALWVMRMLYWTSSMEREF